jgi:hypothetical protein
MRGSEIAAGTCQQAAQAIEQGIRKRACLMSNAYLISFKAGDFYREKMILLMK